MNLFLPSLSLFYPLKPWRKQTKSNFNYLRKSEKSDTDERNTNG